MADVHDLGGKDSDVLPWQMYEIPIRLAEPWGICVTNIVTIVSLCAKVIL